MFPGKVVLKLLSVKNVNYTFLLFPNYLVFIDFCLKADSWIWKIFTHANKGQTTWLDSAILFDLRMPTFCVGVGFKQRSTINTTDDTLCITVKDTVF